jgi:hypothetical protein
MRARPQAALTKRRSAGEQGGQRSRMLANSDLALRNHCFGCDLMLVKEP